MFSVCGESFLKKSADIPIYVAAMSGMQTLRIAGKLADGVFLAGPLGREVTRSMIDYLKDCARRAGRDPNQIKIFLDAIFSVSYDETEAINLVKPTIAKRIIADPRCRSALKQMRVADSLIDEIGRASARLQLSDLLELVSQEMAENFAIAGTPETCLEQIEGYHKLGVTGIVFDSPYGPGGMKEAVRIAGCEIVRKSTKLGK